MSDRLLRKAQKDRLDGLDPRILACRGDRHDWAPMVIKGGLLPKGVSAIRQRDGSYELRQECRTGCGRYRRKRTLPGGRVPYGTPWGYAGGIEGFSEKPGMQMTRTDYKEALEDRITSAIRARGDAPAPVVFSEGA
jgi:hypothetical protein